MAGQGPPASAAPAPAAFGAESPAPPHAGVQEEAGGPQRIRATPLARRVAREVGLDLTRIPGTGPAGRITRSDVEAAQEAGTTPRSTAAAPADREAQGAAGSGAAHPASAMADKVGLRYTVERASPMRQTIAQRLVESKTTVPHFYLTMDCDVGALMAARADINADLEDSGDKVSLNDMIVKACAVALRQVPEANVAWDGDQILHFQDVDIAVAVATDRGLITPVLKGADQKGLRQISREIRALAGRAQEGGLKPSEYQGGTFSVSNLGMYNVQSFQAIINPPQAALLAVGRSERRFVPDADDRPVARTMMTLSLSCDHRAIDGVVGARWLNALRGVIENPLRLTL